MTVSPATVRSVIVTALFCALVGAWLLHRQERRHERHTHQRDEAWRLTVWQLQEGRPPPGHIDSLTALTDDEWDVLDRIEAKWDDAGLTILDAERGDA